MDAITKILIVEHDENDLELLQYELKKGGISFTTQIVQNEKDYRDALITFVPDIILSDYSLPSFDGPTAFIIREELAPDTPFIFVSGNIGEENSIEYIKNGVTDYALKDKLFTLSIKIKRALKESKEKQLKRKTEHELLHSEKRLARAQRLSHMGSWELNLSTNTMMLSDEACRIYGFEPGWNEYSFEHVIKFIHPEDLEIVLTHLNVTHLQHQSTKFDHRIIRADGTIRNIYAESDVELDANGVAIMIYGITYDITHRKLIEEQIEFDRNNLTSLMNITNDSMWSVDKNFRLITSNDRFDELATILTGQVIPKGSNIFEAGFSRKQLTSYKKAYARALKGEAFTELEYTESPIKFWSEISYYPIKKGDEIIGTACHSHDITERRLDELERIRINSDLAQRNKDLEQFAYIISHNLRAPVANIIGVLSIINEAGISIDDKEVLTNGLNESVLKLDDVVKDLNHILQVKSAVNETNEKVCFSDLIGDILASIDDLIKKSKVDIDCDFNDIDEFFALKSYIYSIFYNLITNSIKYSQPDVPCKIKIKSTLIKGNIHLKFADNGMGIDLEKNGDNIFGLYKRFHDNIEGKGMGLFMIKAQVEKLGGKIEIFSEVNKGTTFSIVF